VSLHDLTFSSIGGDAINLVNSSGNVTMSGIQVTRHRKRIVFTEAIPISPFLVQETPSPRKATALCSEPDGGTDAISGLSLKDDGGNGLVINNVATNLTIDSLTVANSGTNGPGSSAVAITGVTGAHANREWRRTNNAYRFTGNTQITHQTRPDFLPVVRTRSSTSPTHVTSSSSSPAVTLVSDTSPIIFGSLTLNTHHATGLFASNVTELEVNGGSLTTVNAPAVDSPHRV